MYHSSLIFVVYYNLSGHTFAQIVQVFFLLRPERFRPIFQLLFFLSSSSISLSFFPSVFPLLHLYFFLPLRPSFFSLFLFVCPSFYFSFPNLASPSTIPPAFPTPLPSSSSPHHFPQLPIPSPSPPFLRNYCSISCIKRV